MIATATSNCSTCIVRIIDYRMVHGFTCAGVLPTQYIKFSEFAGMGHVGHGYIKKGIRELILCYIFVTLCVHLYCSVLSQQLQQHSRQDGGGLYERCSK